MMAYQRGLTAGAAVAARAPYYNAAATLAANGLTPGAIPEVYAGVGTGGVAPAMLPAAAAAVGPGALGPGPMAPPMAPGPMGWPGPVPPMGVGGLSNAEIAINAKQTVNGITTRQFSRREFNDPITTFMTRRMRRMRRLGGPLWNGMFWG